VQNIPNLTPGVENVALFEAIIKSQLAASWQPPAAASPFF
jgi:hypothetical protein